MKTRRDVIIVGAGPIGLAHAWGIKKLNPQLNVIVYEKYAEYQRRHTLVMEHQHLEALMKVTDTTEDNDLVALLNKIKNDPNIRTNELESVFKKVAIDAGVEINIQSVTADTINNEFIAAGRDKPLLVIGADGTHSTVDSCLFPKGNQVKHEFDYVLQLRYEISGDKRATPLNTAGFYAKMLSKGVIASEYVGQYDAVKNQTPVTMQMMISKEAFHDLKTATSKNPIKPFSNEEEGVSDLSFENLPDGLKAFISEYIVTRNIHCRLGEELDPETVRISVNEAPATHAKEVFVEHHDVPIVLVGDAGLGLSYFKGLNAGMQSTARLLSELMPGLRSIVVQSDSKDSNSIVSAARSFTELTFRPPTIEAGLRNYQDWFLRDFAPQKVKEVGTYSTWNIRAPMVAAKVYKSFLRLSEFEDEWDASAALNDRFSYADISKQYYAQFAAGEKAAKESERKGWRLFPHRDHDLVTFGQWTYVPIKHTLNKMAKLFVDYIKPYKSRAQFVQDLRQPLVGLAHATIGLGKIVAGAVTLDGLFMLDGLATFARGVLELATTPLSWTLKTLTRGLITAVVDRPKIEEGKGMQALATMGLQKAGELASSKKTHRTMHELLAICSDLHRKYEKSLKRGQLTAVAELNEYSLLEAARSASSERSDQVKETFVSYLSLFAPKDVNADKANALVDERVVPASRR